MTIGSPGDYNWTTTINTIIPNYSYGEINIGNNTEIIAINNRLKEIEKQMLILKPSIALQEKYPALQEAYDAYQIILKLIKSGEKDVV